MITVRIAEESIATNNGVDKDLATIAILRVIGKLLVITLSLVSELI